MVFCLEGAVSAVSGAALEDAPTDADGPVATPEAVCLTDATTLITEHLYNRG